MKSNSPGLNCPVCNMDVSTEKYSMMYQGNHYVFCSNQCFERFRDNPHLYIGYPGVKSPKQKGEEVLKQRTLKLSKPLSPDTAELVINHIRAMMGINDITIEGNVIKITYDLLQATEEQIEKEIAKSGGVLGQTWADRISRAFVQYMEETEVLTLETTPGSRRGHSHH